MTPTTRRPRTDIYGQAIPAPPYTWAGRHWPGTRSMTTPAIPWAGLYLLVGLIHYNQWPWYLLGAAIPMLGAGFIAVGHRFAQSTIGWTWLTALYGTSWYLWSWLSTAWTTPHLWWTVGVGAAGAAASILTWPAMRRAQLDYEARQYVQRAYGNLPAAQLVAGPDDGGQARGRQWTDLFTHLDRAGVTWVTDDETPAGLTIRMRLPIPGPGVKAIPYSAIDNAAFREAVEQAYNLRSGAVTFEQARRPEGGRSARDFLMHIDFEDILAKIIDMPLSDTPMSISEAFPVGQYTDGQTVYLTVREIHAMIVGVTRAGKSNLLHVIIYQLTRCYDAAIWMIDLKGGATARLWLKPFIDGKARRPVLDWVAIDRWEAARILLAAIDIARGRPRRRTGSKTEPQRAGMPMATTDPATGRRRIADRNVTAILLLTDEVAELLGAHSGPMMANSRTGFTSGQLVKLVTTLSTIAAGEAVWLMAAGQGATADMFGNPSAQKNMGLKIAVGPMEMQAAQQLFGNNARTAAELVNTLEHPGSMVVWKAGHSGRLLPAKVYFVGDESAIDAFCYRAALAHAEIPSTVEIDSFAKAKADEWGYATRWEPDRCGWLYEHRNTGGGDGDWESVPLPLDASGEPMRLSEAAARTTTAPSAPAAAADGYTGTGFWPTTTTPPPAAVVPDVDPADTEPVTFAKVQQVAHIIDGYGPAGVTTADLVRALVAAGVVTERGAKGYRRLVLRAMDPTRVMDANLVVVQPAGDATPYYTRRHQPAPQTANH